MWVIRQQRLAILGMLAGHNPGITASTNFTNAKLLRQLLAAKARFIAACVADLASGTSDTTPG